MKRVLIALMLMSVVGCGRETGRGLEVKTARERAVDFTNVSSWRVTNYAYVKEEGKIQLFLKSGALAKELVVYQNHARFDLYEALMKPDSGSEVVFRYNGEGYILTPASKFHKQDPTNPSSFLFPMSVQKQEQAKADAQEMTKYAWTVVKFADDDPQANFNATVTLVRQGGDRVVMHVSPDHQAWHRYTVLRMLKPGSTIRFEYRASGYNEADITSPEQDERPEYYLAPLVNSEQARNPNDRVPRGPGRFQF